MTRATKSRDRRASTRIGKVRLAEMIEEATVDAHDESEQTTGWFTMFEEHLKLPFETKVLGTTVTVTRIDLRDNHQIVAICTRGRDRQAISLVDLPLPSSKLAGSEDRGVPLLARRKVSDRGGAVGQPRSGSVS